MNPELPPSNREAIEAQITALLLGELTAEEAAALRARMAQDAELAKWHDRLERTLALVRETAATPAGETSAQPTPLKLSEARRQKLLAHFKTVRPREFVEPRRRWVKWLIPAAAAAALLLMPVWLVMRKMAGRTEMDDRTWGLSRQGYFGAGRAVAGGDGNPASSARATDTGAQQMLRGVERSGLLNTPATAYGSTNVYSLNGVGYVTNVTTLPGYNIISAPLVETSPTAAPGSIITSDRNGLLADGRRRAGAAEPMPVAKTPIVLPPAEVEAGDIDQFARLSSDNSWSGRLQSDGNVAGTLNAREVGNSFNRINSGVQAEQAPAPVAAPAPALSDEPHFMLGSTMPGAVAEAKKPVAGETLLQGVRRPAVRAPVDGGKATELGLNNSSIDSAAPKDVARAASSLVPIPGMAGGGGGRRGGRGGGGGIGGGGGGGIGGGGGGRGRGGGGGGSLAFQDRLAEAPGSSVGRSSSGAGAIQRAYQSTNGPVGSANFYVDQDSRQLFEAADEKAKRDGQQVVSNVNGRSVVTAVTIDSADPASVQLALSPLFSSSAAAQPVAGNDGPVWMLGGVPSPSAAQPVAGNDKLLVNYPAAYGPSAAQPVAGNDKLASVRPALSARETANANAVQNNGSVLPWPGQTAAEKVPTLGDTPVFGSLFARQKEAGDVASVSGEDKQLGTTRMRRLTTAPDAAVTNAVLARPAIRGGVGEVTSVWLLTNAPAASPVAKQEADTRRKVDVPLDRMQNPQLIPQPEVQTRTNAFSTFSLNVSDVAFKLAAAGLGNGVMPDASSMRSEEFINAFDYRDPEPAPGAAIGFAWERAGDPFAHNRDFLRFSVKTAAEGRTAGRPLNLVLLLDKSGSMERADRVEIIRRALSVLAGQLQAQDTLSVVVFARTAHLWVDGVSGSQAGDIVRKLSDITPEGGTNLEEAMKLAYQAALRHYLANGENRVVLLTDGAANLGEVNPEAFKPWVESNRKQGIALDCFGVGWEGYDDTTLETLSRSGGGRYGFINTPEEAATGFAGQLAGALRVAASDVKVQVEFNPNRVVAYRQIGYAKHQLTKEQFRDNSVAAAQIGAAESGNGLYTVEVNAAGSGPLCTVRVRYRDPGTSEYHERAWEVPYEGSVTPLDKSSPAMRLAAAAGAFSEKLAGSEFAGEVTYDKLLVCLAGVPEVYGVDKRPQQLEWMVRQARSISGSAR